MRHLVLDRPLAVFDIESTGIDRHSDRLIELAVVKVYPDEKREPHAFRVNPGIPIPAEATAVHGITDEDVKDCPSFEAIAQSVAAVFEHADLAGFNVLRFDLPLLAKEFERVHVPFDVEHRRVVDAQRIFHRKEPRDLSAALQFYCGEMHLEAHRALDDVLATIRVLEGQLERYADLPRDVAALDDFCNPRDPSWVDRSGKLKWADGEVVINFGKNKGRKLRELAQYDTGFLTWMLKNHFPADTQAIVRRALSGHYPAPPS